MVEEQLDSDRDGRGRFVAGNRAGRRTRFRPGRSGNLLGRPPSVKTCLRGLREQRAGLRELYLLADSPDARWTEQQAAITRLVELMLSTPIPAADLVEVKSLRRAWYKKRFFYLATALIDGNQEPERREAARQRLLMGGYRPGRMVRGDHECHSFSQQAVPRLRNRG